MKILGLDLGTNSVGWAIINRDGKGNFQNIEAAGTRVVPMDPKMINNFERGLTISATAERRQKRGIRRLNQRWKMRRDNLISYFQSLGILPNNIPDLEANPQAIDNLLLGSPKTDIEIYELRAKAIQEKVSLKEFARILYHLNHRRGYQPTRSEKRTLKNKKSDTQYGYYTLTQVSETGEILRGKKEFEIHLNDEIIGYSTDPMFPELQGEEIPIKIVSKTNKKGETHITLSIISTDDQEWESRLGAMESSLELANTTPGAFFYHKIVEARKLGKDFKVRDRLVFRKRYLDEFDQIWEEQEKHHPILSDQKSLKKAVKAVMPVRNPDKHIWVKKGHKEFVRDYIIYYQRPLKSQKGSISFCEFEPQKRVIPRSHPLFQEFKIWQQINNLRYMVPGQGMQELADQDKEFVYERLATARYLKASVIAKRLGIKEEELSAPETLSGNTTRTTLIGAAKEAGIHYEKALLNKEQILWHILYSLENEDEEQVGAALIRNCGIPEDKVEPFLDILFPKEYASLSARAIQRILPLMRAGNYFELNDIHPAVVPKIDAILTGVADEKISERVREYFGEAEEPEDFSGLPYWIAVSLIYGSHSQQNKGEAYNSPEDIEGLPLHSLRNPIVEQMVNETLMVVKDIWKQYGRPDYIHLEMAREMKQSAKQRQRVTKKISENQKERAAAREILMGPDFNLPRPSRKDIERYLLWKQQKCRDPYSGDNIPKSALFTGETDVDHIIPKQRYFDDSFNNKVVTFRELNEEKGNLTAFEYMQGRDWEAFVQRVKNNPDLHPKKRHYLLTDTIPEDFVNRQLRDTSYITRQIRSYMERVCPPLENEQGKATPRVIITNGTITDYLKNIWNLNEVFKQVLLPRYRRLEELTQQELIQEEKHRNKSVLRLPGYSKRIDHRHHALDAIVVGLTTRSFIHQLNTLNRIFGTSEMKTRSARKIPLPHPNLRKDILKILRGIIVSQKSRSRLLTQKANYYQKRDEKGQLITVQAEKSGYAVRGQLHNETLYGRVKTYETIDVKKAFECLPDLIVPWQRERVRARLNECGGSIKKAQKSLNKNPIANLKGEAMEKCTIFREWFSSNVKLAAISNKQLKNVADKGLKKELLEHVKRFKGDLKTAFSPEHLAEFNHKRKKPVFSVKVLMNENFSPLNEDGLNPRFVEGGNNYGVVLGELPDGKRDYLMVSFFDAVEMKMSQVNFKNLVGGVNKFFLAPYEAVFVLKEGENKLTVDWSNRVEVGERIYIFRKGTNRQIYFIPHHISLTLEEKDGIEIKEFGTQKLTEFMGVNEDRIKIIQNCIPIKIDRLGNVYPK